MVNQTSTNNIELKVCKPLKKAQDTSQELEQTNEQLCFKCEMEKH